MIQLLTNAVFFLGAYVLGNRGFAQALEQDALARQSAELARERERSTAQLWHWNASGSPASYMTSSPTTSR